MRIIDAAIKESSYNFDHAPTLEELKQGYDSTFVKAWEKAAKALDTDIKPFEKSTPATTAPGKGPSRGVGSGFLGGRVGRGPSKERGPAYKDYGERWETGAPAPLTKDFKGYTGGCLGSQRR